MEVKYPILEWRMGIRQFGISDLGCPRMEEVLRAPAAHGVSNVSIIASQLDISIPASRYRIAPRLNVAALQTNRKLRNPVTKITN